MKIVLNRPCLIGGKHHDIGDIVDVAERDGRYLIAIAAASLAPKKEKKPASSGRKPRGG